MIIDFHNHIADLRRPGEEDRIPVTCESLLRRMDEDGVDKAVVMPVIGSPEIIQPMFYFSGDTDMVGHIEKVSSFSDRFILFGNIDPRAGCFGNLNQEQLENVPLVDFSPYFKIFRELGCLGIGEVTAGLPVDDYRVVNMFRQCGEWDFPVLLHSTGKGKGVYGLTDDPGLPGTARMLEEVGDTVVIAHAPGFWSEISGDISASEKFVYPDGPVRTEGAIQRLLRSYDNLYADISAMSGFNAVSRDRAYGARFLIEFQDRILFGTDSCYGDEKGRMPHLKYLRELRDDNLISEDVFKKITGLNALGILGI